MVSLFEDGEPDALEGARGMPAKEVAASDVKSCVERKYGGKSG
jgi:hypothetical protein